MGGDGNRFSDGGNYFIYRFQPPAGTTKLTITVDMWNQYVIAVTDTAPTRVEPFPNFRDFVVATRALVTWTTPTNEGALADTFAAVKPGTPYAGWFTNDVAGEWGGVELAARHGVEVTAADYYMNATVHAGIREDVSKRIPRPRRSKPTDRIYLTLMFGEGDNIQYCQRRLRDLWDDPKRGKVPTNWTFSPLLADIGPGILHHLQRTRTRNDLLMAGPSGAGYTYPDSWPAADLDTYTRLSGRYLRRTGTDILFSYSTPGRRRGLDQAAGRRRRLVRGAHRRPRYHPDLGEGRRPRHQRTDPGDRFVRARWRPGRLQDGVACLCRRLDDRCTALRRRRDQRLVVDPVRRRHAGRIAAGDFRGDTRRRVLLAATT